MVQLPPGTNKIRAVCHSTDHQKNMTPHPTRCLKRNHLRSKVAIAENSLAFEFGASHDVEQKHLRDIEYQSKEEGQHRPPQTPVQALMQQQLPTPMRTAGGIPALPEVPQRFCKGCYEPNCKKAKKRRKQKLGKVKKMNHNHDKTNVTNMESNMRATVPKLPQLALPTIVGENASSGMLHAPFRCSG
jgi:hypothetical protein